MSQSLVKNTTILFIMNLAGSFLNYLFQIIMGRLFTLSDFGIFNALLSLLMILAVVHFTIMNTTSQRVSILNAENAADKYYPFYKHTVRRVFIISIVILSIYLILLHPLRIFFKVPGYLPIILLGIYCAVSLLLFVNRGFLQGIKSFLAFGSIEVLFPGFQVAFSTLLVLIGAGVSGVFGGMLLSVLILYAATLLFLKRKYFHNTQSSVAEDTIFDRSTLGIFLVHLFFSAFLFIDMIMIKHLLSPDIAGEYAAVVVIGRILFYIPGAIVLVMFPYAVENKQTGKSALPLLIKSMALAASITLVGICLYYFFPEQIVGILFGKRYKEAVPYLWKYALAVSALGLIYVINHFKMSRYEYKQIFYMGGMLLLEIVLVFRYVHSIASMLNVLCLVNYSLLLIYLVSLLIQGRGIIKRWAEKVFRVVDTEFLSRIHVNRNRPLTGRHKRCMQFADFK